MIRYHLDAQKSPPNRALIRMAFGSYAIWAAPALLSLVMSVACIGRAPLWRDEMATRQFSLLPLGSLFTATTHVDRVLTPYYVFMHFWAYLGDGAIALRYSSTIAATIAVAVSARLAQRTWGPTAGFVTGVAMAVNGVFIGASVEARPYALVLMCSAVATLLLTMMIEDRVSRRVWWTYGLVLCAATWMHVFAVLIVLPHALIFWRRARRRQLLWWALSTSPAVLVAGSLVLASVSQSAQLSWVGGKPSLHDIIRLLIEESGQSVKAVVVVLAVSFAVVLQLCRRVVDDIWLVAFGMLVLPTAALFLVSQVSTPVLVARYVITIQLAAPILLGSVVSGVTRMLVGFDGRRVAAITALAIVLVAEVSAGNLSATLTSTDRGDGYRSLADALRTRASPGDGLIIRKIYGSGGFADGIAYYLNDSTFMASISSTLLTGEPLVYTRTIVDTSPFRTMERTGQRNASVVWVVELTPPTRVLADRLATSGCKLQFIPNLAQLEQFGDISLMKYRCPA